MNDIITHVTLDKEIGFDAYGQFCSWEKIEEPGQETRLIGTQIADVRTKTCAICGRGWELSGPSLRNQYHLRDMEQMVHKTCYIGHIALTEAKMINGAMLEAAQQHHKEAIISWRMRPIANEYRGAWNTPWYLMPLTRWPMDTDRRAKRTEADSTGFAIKFGPRKRVYHISLHKPGFDFSSFAPITTDQVTKDHRPGEIMAHAWDDKKVVEYLSAMMKIVIAHTPEP